MVNATATENAFEGEPEFGNGVMKVEDENERKNFETNMHRLGDDKFKLGSSYLGLVKDPLYKGVVFIPVYNNIWNALATSNSAISPGVSQQIETLQQQTDARMNYKSPGAWVN
jgi:hypothetical protein